jgi:hypothetical protein
MGLRLILEGGGFLAVTVAFNRVGMKGELKQRRQLAVYTSQLHW